MLILTGEMFLEQQLKIFNNLRRRRGDYKPMFAEPKVK